MDSQITIQRLTAKNEEDRIYSETAIIDGKTVVTCFMKPEEGEFKIYLRVDNSFCKPDIQRAFGETRRIYQVCTDLIREMLANLRPGETTSEKYYVGAEMSKIRLAKKLGFEVQDELYRHNQVIWTAK